MEEIKDLIKQEDYEKYKKLLQEFECKAIDIIEDLTYQFKETLAEEIDDKIKGWKKDNERILRENWGKDDKIKQLEQELAELKEKAIVPRFEYGDKVYYIRYFVGKWQVFNQEYVGENISNIIVRTMNYYSELPKDSVFATEQEAQEKLRSLKDVYNRT